MAESAAHAAAIAQAIKASGVLVRVAPMEFLKILNHEDKPLVVVAIPNELQGTGLLHEVDGPAPPSRTSAGCRRRQHVDAGLRTPEERLP